jgi:hypothetical protein
LGRKSGFNQRKGGISGYAFADTLVFSGTTFDKHSLNDQSSNLKIRHNIEVSKQGVDERYTDKTIDFIKSILSELLVKVITDNPAIEELSHFNATRIKDSTCFQVPECFVQYFPGSGGSASKAMVRIQFEYDAKTGEVLDLSLHAFNEQDQSDSVNTLHTIKENELCIRDLGYVNRIFLEALIRCQAHYLNRSAANVGIYFEKDDGYEKANFVELKRSMTKEGSRILDTTAYLYGGADKFKTRMIIEMLPDKIVSERIRKMKALAKKNKSTPSAEYIARAYFNIFITSVSADILPKEKIRELYCLRWQIELVFKTWKSFGELHKTKKMKYQRFVSSIYARLIMLMLNWKIFWELLLKKWSSDKLLMSIHKFYKLMISKDSEIREAVSKSANCFHKKINNILSCTRNLVLEKKKGKLSLQEVIMSLVE